MDKFINDLYQFMAACGGNWRNTIYLPCVGCSTHPKCEGYLVAMNSRGAPVFMEIGRLRKLSREEIDPAECLSKMEKAAFEQLAYRFLTWEADDPNICPFPQLQYE